jgi:hypothetical protein
MGIRMANGDIARWKALTFGSSQAPAKFTQVAVEFARLFTVRLRNKGFRGVVIV